MFNSSLAQEMTAYIELRSAAFSDSFGHVFVGIL